MSPVPGSVRDQGCGFEPSGDSLGGLAAIVVFWVSKQGIENRMRELCLLKEGGGVTARHIPVFMRQERVDASSQATSHPFQRTHQ